MRFPLCSAIFILQKYVTFKPDSTAQSTCNLSGSFHWSSHLLLARNVVFVTHCLEKLPKGKGKHQLRHGGENAGLVNSPFKSHNTRMSLVNTDGPKEHMRPSGSLDPFLLFRKSLTSIHLKTLAFSTFSSESQKNKKKAAAYFCRRRRISPAWRRKPSPVSETRGHGKRKNRVVSHLHFPEGPEK